MAAITPPQAEPPGDPQQIVEIVGQYVALHEYMAGEFHGRCPFCQSTAFRVRSSFGTFHCFGCGSGGDIRAFLRDIQK